MQIEQWGIAMTNTKFWLGTFALTLVFLAIVSQLPAEADEVITACIETHQTLNKNESQIICGKLASND